MKRREEKRREEKRRRENIKEEKTRRKKIHVREKVEGRETRCFSNDSGQLKCSHAKAVGAPLWREARFQVKMCFKNHHMSGPLFDAQKHRMFGPLFEVEM